MGMCDTLSRDVIYVNLQISQCIRVLINIFFMPKQMINSKFLLIMLIFNNIWFLEVLLLVLVALICVETIPLYRHHTCIRNCRHNLACMTDKDQKSTGMSKYWNDVWNVIMLLCLCLCMGYKYIYSNNEYMPEGQNTHAQWSMKCLTMQSA